jgi:hypothetical protein
MFYMSNVDLTLPAFVFWLRGSRAGRPGGITRFDRLEDAVNCVMQHAFARTEQVAWIKTVDRHLNMDQIRNVARHSGLVGYLSKTEEASNASAKAHGRETLGC